MSEWLQVSWRLLPCLLRSPVNATSAGKPRNVRSGRNDDQASGLAWRAVSADLRGIAAGGGAVSRPGASKPHASADRARSRSVVEAAERAGGEVTGANP